MSECGLALCLSGSAQLPAWKPGARGSSRGVKVYCGAWARLGWNFKSWVSGLAAVLASSTPSGARGSCQDQHLATLCPGRLGLCSWEGALECR